MELGEKGNYEKEESEEECGKDRREGRGRSNELHPLLIPSLVLLRFFKLKPKPRFTIQTDANRNRVHKRDVGVWQCACLTQ